MSTQAIKENLEISKNDSSIDIDNIFEKTKKYMSTLELNASNLLEKFGLKNNSYDGIVNETTENNIEKTYKNKVLVLKNQLKNESNNLRKQALVSKLINYSLEARGLTIGDVSKQAKDNLSSDELSKFSEQKNEAFKIKEQIEFQKELVEASKSLELNGDRPTVLKEESFSLSDMQKKFSTLHNELNKGNITNEEYTKLLNRYLQAGDSKALKEVFLKSIENIKNEETLNTVQSVLNTGGKTLELAMLSGILPLAMISIEKARKGLPALSVAIGAGILTRIGHILASEDKNFFDKGTEISKEIGFLLLNVAPITGSGIMIWDTIKAFKRGDYLERSASLIGTFISIGFDIFTIAAIASGVGAPLAVGATVARKTAIESFSLAFKSFFKKKGIEAISSKASAEVVKNGSKEAVKQGTTKSHLKEGFSSLGGDLKKLDVLKGVTKDSLVSTWHILTLKPLRDVTLLSINKTNIGKNMFNNRFTGSYIDTLVVKDMMQQTVTSQAIISSRASNYKPLDEAGTLNKETQTQAEKKESLFNRIISRHESYRQDYSPQATKELINNLDKVLNKILKAKVKDKDKDTDVSYRNIEINKILDIIESRSFDMKKMGMADIESAKIHDKLKEHLQNPELPIETKAILLKQIWGSSIEKHYMEKPESIDKQSTEFDNIIHILLDQTKIPDDYKKTISIINDLKQKLDHNKLRINYAVKKLVNNLSKEEDIIQYAPAIQDMVHSFSNVIDFRNLEGFDRLKDNLISSFGKGLQKDILILEILHQTGYSKEFLEGKKRNGAQINSIIKNTTNLRGKFNLEKIFTESDFSINKELIIGGKKLELNVKESDIQNLPKNHVDIMNASKEDLLGILQGFDHQKLSFYGPAISKKVSELVKGGKLEESDLTKLLKKDDIEFNNFIYSLIGKNFTDKTLINKGSNKEKVKVELDDLLKSRGLVDAKIYSKKHGSTTDISQNITADYIQNIKKGLHSEDAMTQLYAFNMLLKIKPLALEHKLSKHIVNLTGLTNKEFDNFSRQIMSKISGDNISDPFFKNIQRLLHSTDQKLEFREDTGLNVVSNKTGSSYSLDVTNFNSLKYEFIGSIVGKTDLGNNKYKDGLGDMWKIIDGIKLDDKLAHTDNKDFDILLGVQRDMRDIEDKIFGNNELLTKFLNDYEIEKINSINSERFVKLVGVLNYVAKNGGAEQRKTLDKFLENNLGKIDNIDVKLSLISNLKDIDDTAFKTIALENAILESIKSNTLLELKSHELFQKIWKNIDDSTINGKIVDDFISSYDKKPEYIKELGSLFENKINFASGDITKLKAILEISRLVSEGYTKETLPQIDGIDIKTAQNLAEIISFDKNIADYFVVSIGNVKQMMGDKYLLDYVSGAIKSNDTILSKLSTIIGAKIVDTQKGLKEIMSGEYIISLDSLKSNIVQIRQAVHAAGGASEGMSQDFAKLTSNILSNIKTVDTNLYKELSKNDIQFTRFDETDIVLDIKGKEVSVLRQAEFLKNGITKVEDEIIDQIAKIKNNNPEYVQKLKSHLNIAEDIQKIELEGDKIKILFNNNENIDTNFRYISLNDTGLKGFFRQNISEQAKKFIDTKTVDIGGIKSTIFDKLNFDFVSIKDGILPRILDSKGNILSSKFEELTLQKLTGLLKDLTNSIKIMNEGKERNKERNKEEILFRQEVSNTELNTKELSFLSKYIDLKEGSTLKTITLALTAKGIMTPEEAQAAEQEIGDQWKAHPEYKDFEKLKAMGKLDEAKAIQERVITEITKEVLKDFINSYEERRRDRMMDKVESLPNVLQTMVADIDIKIKNKLNPGKEQKDINIINNAIIRYVESILYSGGSCVSQLNKIIKTAPELKDTGVIKYLLEIGGNYDKRAQYNKERAQYNKERAQAKERGDKRKEIIEMLKKY